MKNNITDWAQTEYRTFYNDTSITKEDIFYYVYGILHHRGYRDKYQAMLVRGIPRVPMAPDFWTFCKAGRRLADLHLNYETGHRYDLGDPLNQIPDAPKKIKFGRKRNASRGSRTVDDLSMLYIDGIKVYDNIPEAAYKVNGRTPVEWFVDRYGFSTHGESGITNYPLEDVDGEDVRAIIERLVHVGVESDRIIQTLPEEFEPTEWTPKKTGLDMHMDVGGPVQSVL